MKYVAGGICGLALIVLLFKFGWAMVFSDGVMTAKYNNTVGVQVEDSERNRFTHSQSFVEGKVQELSKERLELSKITDKAARKAIIDTLLSDCAQLDIKDINDDGIKDFLQKIRDGKIE